MTEESDDRIRKIAEQQDKLANQVKKAEGSLFELLLSYWSILRESPKMFTRLWRRFMKDDYGPLFKQFTFDMKTIVALNEEYFEKTMATDRVKDIAKTINKVVGDRMGIDDAGKITPGGYLDSLVQDQTAKRQLQQYFYRTRALKNETQLKTELKELVKGVNEQGGVVSRFFDNYVFDTYQEADRLSQNEFAQKLEMPAAIYTGGLIERSRAFCVERNRGVFLREEIAKFGTPADEYGGYTDKSKGLFSGKPRDGYDPFTQCGGHRCRHHHSWISKEYAVRLDKTLAIKEGKLVRAEPSPRKEPVFEAQDTIQKAERWARQNNLATTISYRKADDVDTVNRLNKILFDSKKKFGVSYDKVIFEEDKANPMAFASNQYAFLDGKFRNSQLSINMIPFRSVKQKFGTVDAFIESKNADGWWVPKTFEDIVNHEIGHYLTMPRTDRAAYIAAAEKAAPTKIDISRYGSTKGTEGLAEIWSLYQRDGYDALKPEWVEFFNQYSSFKIKE